MHEANKCRAVSSPQQSRQVGSATKRITLRSLQSTMCSQKSHYYPQHGMLKFQQLPIEFRVGASNKLLILVTMELSIQTTVGAFSPLLWSKPTSLWGRLTHSRLRTIKKCLGSFSGTLIWELPSIVAWPGTHISLTKLLAASFCSFQKHSLTKTKLILGQFSAFRAAFNKHLNLLRWLNLCKLSFGQNLVWEQLLIFLLVWLFLC